MTWSWRHVTDDTRGYAMGDLSVLNLQRNVNILHLCVYPVCSKHFAHMFLRTSELDKSPPKPETKMGGPSKIIEYDMMFGWV